MSESSRRRRSVAGSKATKILTTKEGRKPDRWKNANAVLVHSMSGGEPIQNESSQRLNCGGPAASERGRRDPSKLKNGRWTGAALSLQ